MNKISAEIIADRIGPDNNRITTFVLTFPRFILAELNTHRALSKNSASSRAIPFEKMLASVKGDPFIPIAFQKDHKGMQGNEYYEGEEKEKCIKDWLIARDAAVEAASGFSLPITKQLRNRLLEPFLWHKVIVTATEFENFFALRDHPSAEIHIGELAHKMLEEYNKSEPKISLLGEWHIPFGDKIDSERIKKELIESGVEKTEILARVKIGVARCARISYNNFDGKDDYVADINLCNRLFGSKPMHLSPTEHVAICDPGSHYGNFKGWKQFRYTFPNQNASDSRVEPKQWKLSPITNFN